MAVSSSPAGSPADSQSKKQSSNEQIEVKMDRSETPMEQDPNQQSDLTTKSSTDGIRVGNSDPKNGGKTCHQCRQKIMVLAAGCKNKKKDNKQCPMKFCKKCLLNRYGEIAEEKEALDDWKCPKCRNICNCSQCMKKKGLKPTGILVHAAKKTGFSSVSELLDAKGPEACQELIVKNKIEVSEGSVSSKKRVKENFDTTCDTNLNSGGAKKAKFEGRENVEVTGDNDTLNSSAKTDLQEVAEKRENVDGNECVDPTKESQKKKTRTKSRKLDETLNDHAVEAVLPPGTLLSSVTGIDLLPEEVGHALQFLEFCSTFGEVLDIRKGQPESVLRDITSERGRRKGKYSSAVQFLTQLLSFILKGNEEKSPTISPDNDNDFWVYSLKKCISESDCVLADIPNDCLDQGIDGYEMLEPSQKLKLLTFLCDETLCTIEMRNWIDNQHQKFVQKVKEARRTLNDAKEKEREANLKLQDEVTMEARLEMTAGNEVLHTNSEHDSKVSEIKAEAEQARLEILEAKDSVPKKKQRSDALRTQPILLDDKGRVYWRLKCFSDSDLLLQDIQDPTYQPVSNEKWFSYDAEEKKVIEKRISSRRLKRRRLHKLNDPLIRMKNSNSESDCEGDSSSNDDSTTPPNVGPVSMGTNDDSTPTVNNS